MTDVYRRLQKNKVEYKLTILILSLPNRLDKLSNLLQNIKKQTVRKPVQVIYLGDNKSMSVGKKRNLSLLLANGRYVVWVDDDDDIAPDYVDKILEAIESNPEVITFNVQKFDGEKKSKVHKYYYNNGNPCRIAPDLSHYKMMPNHLCVWRKDIIQKAFPDKSLSEDHVWSMDMSECYTSTHNIDEILYYYMYDKNLSETH